MAFIDYYKIMGVDKSATQDDIRKAYRHRAKIWHPDLHPDDPKAKAKFQALNEANTVLSDPEKRAKYDKYGENWEHADQFEQAGGGYGGYGGGGFGGFDFSQFSGGAGGGFSSFFEDLFGGRMGGGGRSRMRAPEADMEAKVQIDLYTRRRNHFADAKRAATPESKARNAERLQGAPARQGLPPFRRHVWQPHHHL